MSGGCMSDPVAAELERHDFGEAVGGYTECSCGWPSGRAEYEAEPHAAHVARAIRPLIEAEVRERIAGEIEGSYLGPDFGRAFDGRESPDARLHDAYDQGLERAAVIARAKGQK